MKKCFVFLFSLFCFSFLFAQQPTTKELYETAKNFMRQGDYENATLVLNRALQQDPKNLDMLKDFAFLCMLKRDYTKSIETGKALIERPDADEQTFQVLGMAYKAINDNKECDKLYQRGLKKFPNSGVLYNDLGELLAMEKNMPGAIVQWEKGIEKDPNYSGNYYNATMYYTTINEPFWILTYGEIFLNVESYSIRSASVKSVLLDAYKKLYARGDLSKNISDAKNSFEKAVLETLNKSNTLASEGITPENLTAIRARFILDWFHSKNNEKFPFRLFDHQQYLLREGLFDAYNQWIFGAAASPSAYQVWADTHDKQAAGFRTFQQSRVFKLPAGQYYKNR